MKLSNLFENDSPGISEVEVDKILARQCDLIQEGQERDSKKYGLVGAAVLDPERHMTVATSLLDDKNLYSHAERTAVRLYENRYGPISKDCVIITTLSPCSKPMGDREGRSCTDLIDSLGITKVYCGYEDPTQDDGENYDEKKFQVTATKNRDIRDRCKGFADQFLNPAVQEGLGKKIGGALAGLAVATAPMALNTGEKAPIDHHQKIDQNQVMILAHTMYGEARSAGPQGMAAIGHVILNRAKDTKHSRLFGGTTVKDVALKHNQFSCWNKGDPALANVKEMEDINKAIRTRTSPVRGMTFDQWYKKFKNSGKHLDYQEWQAAYKIAQDILAGKSRDFTGGATYYHTKSINPFWAKYMDRTGAVGSHIFYKLPHDQAKLDALFHKKRVSESSESIKLGASEKKESAQRAIDDINSRFSQNPMNSRQRVMVFDHNGEQALVIFSLKPSHSIPGAIEIEWIQSYPRGEKIGKQGMQELQRLARDHNMTLTLWPWDKGQMSQSLLMRIYKKMGFQPINKNGKAMFWKP